MSTVQDIIAVDKEDIKTPKALAKEQEREKLPAEVTFDKAVYGGISYFAQAATGILVCHWLKHGGGKQYYAKVAEWVGKNIFKAKAGEEAIKAGNEFTLVTTMIMVGNSFLLPVKWLENRKPQIIRKWHEKNLAKEEARGHIQTPEEKAHDDKCLQQLEKEAPQTWGSLIEGRAASLIGVYAAVTAMRKPNKYIEDFSIKNILKGLDGVGLKSLSKSKLLDEYLHVGFLDVFYSMISAGGLYVHTHFIHPPKKHDIASLSDSEAVVSPLTPLLVEAELASEKETTPKKNFSTSISPAKNILKEPATLHTQKITMDSEHLSPSLAV